MSTIIFIILLIITSILFAYFMVNCIILFIQKIRKKDTWRNRMGPIKRVGLMIPAFILITILLVVYTQLSAKTPMVSEQSDLMAKNGISELERINTNGRNEWISIRGENKDNPIILFLAGGPGGTQLSAVRKNLAALEKDYVVVNWDQPGSGKSYNAMPLEKITVDTYIEDGLAVSEYLRNRFGQEKIYLIGESWGSALAIFLAAEKPYYYAALIGTGQMVNFKETEILDYYKALQIAEEKKDEKKIDKLIANGVPPYYGEDVTWKSAEYLNYLSAYMATNNEIYNSGYDTIGDIMSAEYGIMDKINFVRGVTNTFGIVYQKLYQIDLRESYTSLDVPVYFFIGSHDINAPISLVEDYYKILDAPKKDLIMFTHSGHSPWINESAKFVKEVRNVFDGI